MNKKPTKLLELSGAFKKNPQRKRPNEPRPSGPLGDPPDRLPAEAKPYWDEIVEMAPDGVLTSADRWSVELAARFMAKLNSPPNVAAILEMAKSFDLSSADVKSLIAHERITSAELAFLNRLLAVMGFTPADRSKLSVPQAKPTNRFTDLANGPRRPN